MSRTIRKLPITRWKNYGKWYASCLPYTKPDYSNIRIFHYHPNQRWEGDSILQIIFKNNIDETFYEIIEHENGYRQVIIKKHFSIKDTYEDEDKIFEERIMDYARKNGTCKRQRKNGVRLTKKLDRRQRRAQAKMDLIKEFNTIEQDEPDEAQRLLLSEKRERKSLLRSRRYNARKNYEKSLKESTALGFDELYGEKYYENHPWYFY
jgi:hypothetical protein